MSALENKLPTSTLGLKGVKPQTFGVNPNNALHNLYSVDGNPDITWRLIPRNIPIDTTPSQMDELDPIAPNLQPVGVVSQVYKSVSGRRYEDLGPLEGRF